jgi:putative endonuclease
MYFVYVIESLKDGGFYIGKTSDLTARLRWHNSKELNKGVTRSKMPWRYFYTLEVGNPGTSGKIENHIKRMKSREYVLNLAKYPEIGKKLIEKYS